MHVDAEALAHSLGHAGLGGVDDAEQGLARSLSDETQARRCGTHERREGELSVLTAAAATYVAAAVTAILQLLYFVLRLQGSDRDR